MFLSHSDYSYYLNMPVIEPAVPNGSHIVEEDGVLNFRYNVLFVVHHRLPTSTVCLFFLRYVFSQAESV